MSTESDGLGHKIWKQTELRHSSFSQAEWAVVPFEEGRGGVRRSAYSREQDLFILYSSIKFKGILTNQVQIKLKGCFITSFLPEWEACSVSVILFMGLTFSRAIVLLSW